MMFNTGDLILDAVILSIVARTPEGTYGYKITQDVRSKMDVPESTFYPLLKQMQMDGYLEVYHKDFGGRSRRFYKITESGRERLEFCQQNWTNYLQNASTLLMSGAAQAQEPAPQAQQQVQQAPPMQAQAPQPQVQQAPPMQMQAPQPQVQQAPPMQAQAPQPQAQQTAMGNDFDFSIGGDEPVAESDNSLFEFDTFSAAPVAEQAAYQEPAIAEPQAVYQEQTAVEPQAVYQEQQVVYQEQAAPEPQVTYEEVPAYQEQPVMEQQIAYEEPVMPEQQAVYEAPVEESVSEPEMIPENDEDDFLAEMAMGDAGEVIEPEEAAVEETVADSTLGIDGIENTFSESAEISELEDLISQLRSFEKVMSQRPMENTASEASPASEAENVTIKDINGVASLLSTAPAPSANTQQPAKQSTSAPQQTAPVSAANTNTSPVRYTEVRNPDTDDSVNSLVDLLKDDQPKKKSRFFNWGSKKSSGAAQFAASSAPTPKAEAAPVARPEPVPAKPVAKVNTPSPAMVQQEIQKPQSVSPASAQNAAPVSNTQPAGMNTPGPVPAKPASARPVAKRTVREVEDNNSVDSLVELLKGDSENSKPVSIFGKSYTKVKAQQAAPQPTTDTAAIPKPSVSEPKVFKPTASKTFEEKAASPNARPVETTATITKSLDAKAISTKPAAAKPAEAKSVETKAVVTPKPETAPAATAEAPQEAPMDDFKARLLQAHLLPDEK